MKLNVVQRLAASIAEFTQPWIVRSPVRLPDLIQSEGSASAVLIRGQRTWFLRFGIGPCSLRMAQA